MSAVQAVDDRALGTSVRLVVTRPAGLAPAKAALDALLLAVDSACSRFREDSELSRLNAAPGQEVTGPLFTGADSAWQQASASAGTFFSAWLDGGLTRR